MLPVVDLARLLFDHAPDAVLAARPESLWGDSEMIGAVFLLRARPAADAYIVRYSGICSVRRVRITLNVGQGLDRVEDIETDTVYAIVGDPSPVVDIDPSDPTRIYDGAQQTEQAERERLCSAFDKPDTVIEATSAGDVYYLSRALSVLPVLMQNLAAVDCVDLGQRCPADLPTQLTAAELQKVGPCDDPELIEALGIEANHICVVADFRTRGNRFEEEGWSVIAAGPYPETGTFTPTRIFARPSHTIID